MYSQARKLHLIEEVLKIQSEATLIAIENFLNKSKEINDQGTTSGFRDFSGIWGKDEAEERERIIEDSCETIHPDDWK